jgi:MYXO-CTERM domain-containing protein
MTGYRSCRAIGAAFFLVIASGHAARANGAFPDSLSVIAPPDRPHETTLATNFGLISSIDDGQTWSWSCESEATSNGYLYQMGPPPEDRLFALSDNGDLAFSDDRACTWTIAQGAVASGSAVDVFPDPNDAQRVFAIVSPNGKLGSQTTYTLVVSHDGGVTFVPLLTGAKSQVLTGVEVPQLDPKTIYVTASTAPNFTPELIRSTDDGKTWQTIDLSKLIDASDVRLIAIDTENPKRLFLRATTLTGEALAVVDDAGASIRTPVALQAGRFTAFLRRSAGDILIAGVIDKEAFLYRSSDAALTFTRVSGAPHLRALAARYGILWGAADNKEDGFALALSNDQGDTWRPVMRFDQVSAISSCLKASCQSSCASEAKRSVWPAAICGPEPLDVSFADAASDAQAVGSARFVASGGCDCSSGSDARHSSGGVAGALVVLALLRMRRRAVTD